ncbi:magnesium transporter [Alteribacillus bidgolensis]|uniref:Magnesium transporter MgtE n=1 Tax=Alteribacillus bidgolensis TaxID=930129 RepID=A0A1G8QIN2_9BACI|nr:magnesium transporter [Alteribacillus bidgolensis]SDJ04577.1 magnesium transporter [Alteribacillus bidgolensis]
MIQDSIDQMKKQVRNWLKEHDERTFRETFLDWHANDQMQVIRELEKQERRLLYEWLTPAEFSDIFQEMDYEDQFFTVKEMNENYAAEMLNEVSADDAAAFFDKIPMEERKESLLKMMDPAEAAKVREILSYPRETAGAIMTKEYLEIFADQTVRDVMTFLRKTGQDVETIYYLYVVNGEGSLVGVVSLRDVIVNNENADIRDIMSTRVVSAEDDLDQEEVARMIKTYDLLAVPVVNKQKDLVGIVTVDDVMDVLEDEMTEDIGEISASKGSTDTNLTAVQAAKKRAPWIVLLMFLGLITANVIGQYEETLEAVVLLSVFIPLIMDSAGNTGTQSLAVVVRSLATGSFERKGISQMLKRELGTGVLMGLICAVVLIITVSIIYDSPMLAGIVAVSIFLTLSVAAFIGAVLPLIINKLHIDPAVASGPFITTLNDIIGLFIYFTIATSFIQHL